MSLSPISSTLFSQPSVSTGLKPVAIGTSAPQKVDTFTPSAHHQRQGMSINQAEKLVEKLENSYAKWTKLRLKDNEIEKAWKRSIDRLNKGIKKSTNGRVEVSGLDLIKLNLSNLNLDGAHLVSADLTGTTLNGTSFKKAQLQHAKFGSVSYQKNCGTEKLVTTGENTVFTGANLEKTEFEGVDLRNAYFRKVVTDKGTSFYNAGLRRANFSGTPEKLQRIYAEFEKANLTDADLSYTHLYEGNLSEAILSGTNFYNSSLWKAYLNKATIDTTTNFRGANLVWVKAHDTNISDAQMNSSKSDNPTFVNIIEVSNEEKKKLEAKGLNTLTYEFNPEGFQFAESVISIRNRYLSDPAYQKLDQAGQEAFVATRIRESMEEFETLRDLGWTISHDPTYSKETEANLIKKALESMPKYAYEYRNLEVKTKILKDKISTFRSFQS
jgi:uncharacterized protein YjbI with pentapeptide repeats